MKDEIRKMRDLTDKPFGVNIAQAFVRDPGIVDFVVGQGVKFVTTSAGSPTKYTKPLKEAGLTVFHVVPSLAGALKAIDAGVDGLVVEGGEGGGFKNPRDVATMVLLPLVASKSERADHRGGRDGGRPEHGRRLRARRRGHPDGHAHGLVARVAGARELEAGDRRRGGDRHRVPEPEPRPRPARAPHGALRGSSSTPTHNVMSEFGDRANVMKLYFGGDLEAALALSGQVAGRIDAVRPVADVIRETAADCLALLERLAARYPRAGAST